MSRALHAATAAAIGVACALGARAVADGDRGSRAPEAKPAPRVVEIPPSRPTEASALARRLDELEAAVARAEAVRATAAPVVEPAPNVAIGKDEAVRLTRVDRDFPRALRAWREIARREPSSADAWAAIGDLERRMGDAAAAETAFRKAVEHATTDAALRRRAAVETAKLAAKRGAHDEAMRLAETVAAEEGVDVETWGAAKCLVASSALQTGDRTRARAEWESVLTAAALEPRLRAAALKARRAIDALGSSR